MNISNNSLRFQVLWNRLLAIVEEQAQVLIRTAFSPLVRTCGDVSVGIFDVKGQMLAQAVTGTPGHVNTMAESVKHFLKRFPLETMKDGDVFITNDPWYGTGHLNDFVVLTPALHDGRCVGLFACTSHIMDIGGLGSSTEALDVFSEGIYVPHLKLFDRGKINETLVAMLESNSRLPVDIVGDTYSLAACNDAGVRRLRETFSEFAMTDIDDLSDHIIDTSREAVLKQLRELPHGTWRNEMTLDGYDAPITLRASLTLSADGIHIDFDGTDPIVAKGINVPLTYTTAYAAFGVACSVYRDIPNNAGSLAPVTVSAPEGCIVNARKPAPVGARHVIGQMIPDLILGCLAQVVPDRIPAEGASCMWNISIRGTAASGRNYALSMMTSGGMGARSTLDGLSATAFPTGIFGMPVELAETQAPLIFWRKELRRDSGGSGRTRGGLGQVIEFENIEGKPSKLNSAFERIHHPARGRFGGSPGAPGYVGLASGEMLKGKGLQLIPAGARVVLHTPGGAGLGDAAERSPELVESDLKEERISRQAARDQYRFKGDVTA